LYLAVGDVWEFRSRSGFTSGIIIAGVLHAVLSISLWRILPIHILNLLTVAVIESLAVMVILYRSLKLQE
jgi:hypothetical protein